MSKVNFLEIAILHTILIRNQLPYLTELIALRHPQLCFSNTLCHSSHLRDLFSAVQCHQPVDQ